LLEVADRSQQEAVDRVVKMVAAVGVCAEVVTFSGGRYLSTMAVVGGCSGE